MIAALLLAPLLAAGATAPPPPPAEGVLPGLLRLELDPDDAPALLEIARAYTEAGNPTLARHYLARLLRAWPHDPEALALLAECEWALGDTDTAAARFERLRLAFPERVDFQDRWRALNAPAGPAGPSLQGAPFWVGSAYLSTLLYHGSSARESATVQETAVRAGTMGGGHVSAGVVRTRVDLRDFADDTQWEVKLKTGFFPSPGLLVHSGFTAVKSETTDWGEAWVIGAGAESIGPAAGVRPSAFFFLQEHPGGRDAQANLVLGGGGPQGSFRLSGPVQAAFPEDGGTDWSAFPRLDLTAAVTPASHVTIGAGAGRMRREVRGFHDVLYNQDDAHRWSGSMRVSRAVAGGLLEWATGVDGYEAAEGGTYRALSHVLAIHLNSDSHQLPLGRSDSSGWALTLGARARPLSAAWSSPAPAPLVERAVAPIRIGSAEPYPGRGQTVVYEDATVFRDYLNPRANDGRAFFAVADLRQLNKGEYYDTVDFQSRELRYRLTDDLASTADRWREHDPGFRLGIDGPAIMIGGLAVQPGLSYDLQRTERTIDRAFHQAVVEDETRRLFRYPVSATYWIIHDTDAFARVWQPLVPPPSPARATTEKRREFTRYEARHRAEAEITAQDAALRLTACRRLGPITLRLAGGPVWTVTEAEFQTRTTWRERGQETVLRVDTRHDHDQAFQLGWTAGLGLRWHPVDTAPWFVETTLDWSATPKSTLRAGGSAAEIGREEWSASASLGVDL